MIIFPMTITWGLPYHCCNSSDMGDIFLSHRNSGTVTTQQYIFCRKKTKLASQQKRISFPVSRALHSLSHNNNNKTTSVCTNYTPCLRKK